MTKKELEQLKKMSTQTFGRPNEWAKIVAKGEIKPSTLLTDDGVAIPIKKWHPVTIEEVTKRMQTMLDEQAAALAASKLKTEESSGKEEKTQ